MRCAVALPTIAARADEHLSLTPRAQKQPGIVHRSPRRRGLDDPTSPGNTGLGAVRQCGSVAQPRTLTAKSLRSEAASVSSPSPISLQPLNDVTLAHEATALCDQHHRFAGETTASQRRGRGAASEHVRPRRRIRLRRAVRRISALLRSHQHPKHLRRVQRSKCSQIRVRSRDRVRNAGLGPPGSRRSSGVRRVPRACSKGCATRLPRSGSGSRGSSTTRPEGGRELASWSMRMPSDL